jgi:hypothetical protein
MLGARQRPGALASVDPAPHPGRHPVRIRAERTTLDDGVLGQQVQVGHGGEDPVDPHRARLLRGDGAGPARDRGVVERGERGGRRKFGQPGHLLSGPALEVGGDQQRPAGPPQQVGGEPPNRLHAAAEQDEPADADVERIGDGAGLVGEAAVGARTQRGEDESSDGQCHGIMVG